MTGEISQIAMASNITPKKFFTASIQPPARGNSAPADRPISSSGTPMPSAMHEQRDAAQHGIAGLGDIGKRAGQRRGDAGADNDGRQRAHGEHAEQIAALHLVGWRSESLLCKNAGQLQFVEAEHGQRQRHENQGEPTPSTQGFCRALESSVPDRPAATPAAA